MNFKQRPFEKDIETLAKEVEGHSRKYDIEKPDELVLRAVLGNRVYQNKKRIINYPQEKAMIPQPQKEVAEALPSYLEKESDEIKSKVEELIDFTFKMGIDKGVEKARLCSPFILDVYHDALTAKLYEELKRRRLL